MTDSAAIDQILDWVRKTKSLTLTTREFSRLAADLRTMDEEDQIWLLSHKRKLKEFILFDRPETPEQLASRWRAAEESTRR